MWKFTRNVFLLVFMWIPWSCSNNGLHGCECNIMDGCDAQGNPKPNWDEHLPLGVDKFGYVVQGAQNLAYLCEDGTIAILFDGNAKIPLYSAIVMTAQQLSDSPGNRQNYFRQSSKVDRKYQQKPDYYKNSSQRDLCIKRRATKSRAVDKKWASSAEKVSKKKTAGRTGRVDICIPALKANVHQGHLIASQYGRGDEKRTKATFTYTNVVPQFGSFNSGPWQRCESSLIKWGRNNCAIKGAQNLKLSIVVGAIPSTVFRPSQARFFGKEGFSDYQDEVEANYPVNVPKELWTAACCTFQYKDDKGNLQTGTKSTGFWRENDPGNSPCNKINIQALNIRLSGMIIGNINLFPLSPQCYNNNNYIPLQC